MNYEVYSMSNAGYVNEKNLHMQAHSQYLIYLNIV